ncbi:hypothetical protein BKN37_13600 [Mycobacterium talmoniae]|uniref:Uncharacterized protein n=2 Tax=Mycobacterium talmoniae TaxID=1858794 RepID=A0A1S1NIC1_9MYCO|nr:hypothetical protein BKN37_13600 [Mycobacterium talmoniae]
MRPPWLAVAAAAAGLAVIVAAVAPAPRGPDAVGGGRDLFVAAPTAPHHDGTPDRLVPFAIGKDTCPHHREDDAGCGPADGPVFTLVLDDGTWFINTVAFDTRAVVPRRLVTRVRWEFNDPPRLPHAVIQYAAPAAAQVRTFVAADPDDPAPVRASWIKVTVLESVPAPGGDTMGAPWPGETVDGGTLRGAGPGEPFVVYGHRAADDTTTTADTAAGDMSGDPGTSHQEGR